jgi:hypothetical protein
MAMQIDGDATETVGEVEHLIVPNLVAAAPAVDEDDRRPGTPVLIEDPHTRLDL